MSFGQPHSTTAIKYTITIPLLQIHLQ